MVRFFFMILFVCFTIKNTYAITNEDNKEDTKKAPSKIIENSLKDPYIALGENIEKYSQKFLNTRYVYGGKKPGGFDCSGFVRYCFQQFGMPLTIGSRDLSKLGYDIPAAGALPGDLIFFRRSKDYKSQVSHVGMIVEANDCYVKFIHSSVGNGVRYSYLHEEYYASHFVSVRRVIDGLKNYKY